MLRNLQIRHLLGRRVCPLLALWLSAPLLAAESFPEVWALPSRPELPDPLVMFDGTAVTTRGQWEGERRPELKRLFQHYMYGQMPPAPGGMKYKVRNLGSDCLGGKASLKEILITFGPAPAPSMHLVLVVPNQRKKPVPVFLGLNFNGNHTVLNDPSISLPTFWMPNSSPGCTNNRATDAGRGAEVGVWAIEQSIDRGYAVATFCYGDIDPDRPDAPDGVRAWFARGAGRTPGVEAGSTPQYDWGDIASWAWGVRRAVDYLVTDRDIDRHRIAAVGHSRNGKAVMLAAAMDDRIALVIPHQAGCGGTAPSRGKVGESVKQINDRFPHWFNAEFKKFNLKPERLPFDQHCLVALCAPRPVLFSNATEDTWANPEGQFAMLKAAEPVYRLMKAGAVGAEAMPEVGKLVDTKLGFYIRPGKHSMTTDDWKIFLDFADKHLLADKRPRR